MIVTMSSNNPEPRKAAVSIKDCASLCGLSRQRFMQLVKAGVFPAPLYDVASKRPFYSEEMQAQCLEVRRRNVGINGRVVMFYGRRPAGVKPTPRPKKSQPAAIDVAALADVVHGVRELGLAAVTTAQVRKAAEQLYPQGIGGVDLGVVAGEIFSHQKGKNS
jgi:hypothetical protein